MTSPSEENQNTDRKISEAMVGALKGNFPNWHEKLDVLESSLREDAVPKRVAGGVLSDLLKDVRLYQMDASAVDNEALVGFCNATVDAIYGLAEAYQLQVGETANRAPIPKKDKHTR